jgi:hypothetical protein
MIYVFIDVEVLISLEDGIIPCKEKITVKIVNPDLNNVMLRILYLFHRW